MRQHATASQLKGSEPRLTFSLGVSIVTRWTELRLFGATKAGGALLSGETPTDGPGPLFVAGME